MGIFDLFKSNNRVSVNNNPKSEHVLSHLLTSQKNGIFQLLKDGGIDETLIGQIEIYEGDRANQFVQMPDNDIGSPAVFSFQKKGF